MSTAYMRREIRCKDCDCIVDSQIAVKGAEGMVGALLTGDSIKIHRILSNCGCSGVTTSDWQPDWQEEPAP